MIVHLTINLWWFVWLLVVGFVVFEFMGLREAWKDNKFARNQPYGNITDWQYVSRYRAWRKWARPQVWLVLKLQRLLGVIK